MTGSAKDVTAIDPNEGSDVALRAVLRTLDARWAAGAVREVPAPSDPQAEATEAEEEPLVQVPANIAIRFVIDDETRQVSAWVVDRDTGEVLRTVPPEELMRLIKKSGRLTGVFVEECL